LFRVPVGSFEDAPRPRIALVTRGGAPLSEAELPERPTFVLGAEREGLPDDIVRDCDVQVTIPLARSAESLNVAVTAAIALYEWSSRHRRPRR
jgi:TrmH family RNA methyltransferase